MASCFLTAGSLLLTACGQEKPFSESATTETGSAISPSGQDMVQPTLTSAWVRPTVEGQMATAAYFELNVPVNMTWIGAETPAAGVVELHDMVMEGDVMQMRKLESATLTPSVPLVLKPGGKHLMLMDLRAPIAEGSIVPITLRLKASNGEEVELKTQAKACAQPC